MRDEGRQKSAEELMRTMDSFNTAIRDAGDTPFYCDAMKKNESIRFPLRCRCP